jgi:LuxR family maltose regulon positive regulatory protein
MPAGLDDGASLLARHGVQGLRIALPTADETATDSGWTSFWRGYVAQFDDLGRAGAEWARAEEFFARAGDATGLAMAACGLVQVTVLDNQKLDGFEARAERVAQIALAPKPSDALDLFRLAARLAVAAQRREADGLTAPFAACAFAALALDVDPQQRLRTAVAALPALGLALDRAQLDDFFHAGGTLVRSPLVTDYDRALWHLHVVEALFYDASRGPQLRTELDALERLQPSGSLRVLRARGLVLRAALALSDGEAAEAKAHLDAAHVLLDPLYPHDYSLLHYYLSRHALLIGHAEDAWAHLRLCHQKQAEARMNPERSTTLLMQEGFVQCALRRYADASRVFQQAGDLSLGAQATPCHCHVHLTRALQRLREGAHPDARAELLAGFTHARTIDLTHFFRALPALAAELCGAALDLDADAAFARKVIDARHLPCPDLGIARWPWPLRVRMLGDLAIERGGVAFKPARKAPKRLIDLIRLVVAWGGRRVDAARVATALWPDAEGDVARDSLKAMLHRARTLLGAAALQVRDGQISFDERAAWLDTWAFEHVAARVEALLGSTGAAAEDGELARRALQLLALYRGHFLGEGEVPAWALPLRDRLRARFVRSVELLGQRLERTGRQDEAIHLYRAALEQDNLAEELYQRLIECHLARGEQSQALGAYRRCRELLSIVLGLRPSARTEALAARINAH